MQLVGLKIGFCAQSTGAAAQVTATGSIVQAMRKLFVSKAGDARIVRASELVSSTESDGVGVCFVKRMNWCLQ